MYISIQLCARLCFRWWGHTQALVINRHCHGKLRSSPFVTVGTSCLFVM